MGIENIDILIDDEEPKKGTPDKMPKNSGEDKS